MTPRHKSIRNHAINAFKDHILEPQVKEGPVRQWLVRTPGTGVHHFYVTIFRRTIVVSGDTCDAILNVSDEDPLPWIRSACDPGRTSYDYVASKIRTAPDKTFDRRLAEEFMNTYVEDSGAEGPEEIAIKRDQISQLRADADLSDDSGHSFVEACNDLGIELEGDEVWDYPGDHYWAVECLRAFARLYEAA